jgi:hypothetical protein
MHFKVYDHYSYLQSCHHTFLGSDGLVIAVTSLMMILSRNAELSRLLQIE